MRPLRIERRWMGDTAKIPVVASLADLHRSVGSAFWRVLHSGWSVFVAGAKFGGPLFEKKEEQSELSANSSAKLDLWDERCISWVRLFHPSTYLPGISGNTLSIHSTMHVLEHFSLFPLGRRIYRPQKAAQTRWLVSRAH